MSFKVGDKVRLKEYSDIYACIGFDSKEIYEIVEVDTDCVCIVEYGKKFCITNEAFELVEPCNETIIPYAIGQKVWAVTSEISIDYKTGAKETVYSAEEFDIYSMIVHKDCVTLFDENERKVGVVGKNVFTSKAEAQAECDKLNTSKWSKVAMNEAEVKAFEMFLECLGRYIKDKIK